MSKQYDYYNEVNKQVEDREALKQRLDEPCTLIYFVWSDVKLKAFDTAQEAVNWSQQQEYEGTISTDYYEFSDGVRIYSNVYIWQLSETHPLYGRQ